MLVPHLKNWITFTWGLVGFGIGLLVLSVFLWLRQAGIIENDNTASLANNELKDSLIELRAGQLPLPEASEQKQWAPLWKALNDLHRQRADAWLVYENNATQAAAMAWLKPEKLVEPNGRAELSKRLHTHDKALRQWLQTEATVKSEFDAAFQAWLAQAPQWLPQSARSALFSASTEVSKTLDDYAETEQSLLLQTRHLIEHIISLGKRVDLDDGELVFENTIDLSRYRSSLLQLSDLTQQKETQRVQVQQVNQRHIELITQAFNALLEPTPANQPQ